MIARIRLLTLALIVFVTVLTTVAVIERPREVGVPAVDLQPATPDANRTFRVTATRIPHVLHVGDVVEIDDPVTLASLQLHTLRFGSQLIVRRVKPARAEPIAVPILAPRHIASILYAFVVIVFVLLAVAFFIALRAESTGAISLALFFTLIVFLLDPATPSWPPVAILAYAVFTNVPLVIGCLFAIDFSTRLTSDAETPLMQRYRRIMWRAGLIIVVVPAIINVLQLFTFATPSWVVNLGFAMAAAPVGFVVTLVVVYVRATAAERQRVVWVIASLGLGIVGLLATIILSILNVAEPGRDYPLILLVLMPIGCAYAILRYRLLDIGFVINRAAVFGATSLVVLGALALADLGLQQLLGSWLIVNGAAVQIAIALVIGIATRPIHARVDTFVDDVFFRDRHAVVERLRNFARDVAFVDDANVALLATVSNVAEASRLQCSAFLENDRAYAMAVSSEGPSEGYADGNDPAVVRMRSTRSHVDLSTVPTTVAGQFAFPMFARSRLLGFLVCGGKAQNLEAYSPDEMAAITSVAEAVGVSLDLLRIERLEQELAALRKAR